MFILFVLIGGMLLGAGIAKWCFMPSRIKIPKEKRRNPNRHHYYYGELFWMGLKETIKGAKER